ncbi:MAG: transposase, partial [Verrucomicrobia bacterium]
MSVDQVPRKPRIHVHGGFFHVIVRGNARQNIFFEEDDRYMWEDIIQQGIERYEHRIHAYCWMTNHVHIVVQAGTVRLSGFMCFIASKYAKASNRKTRRSGHLFGRRYQSILVQESSYLKELVRYIHLNPVRANMVSSPASYPWSSHHAYAGAAHPAWLTIDQVLAQFSNSERIARRSYLKFMGAQPSNQTLELLRQGAESDNRVLGTDNWCAAILKEADNQVNSKNLDTLIEEICERYGVTESLLASNSRARPLAKVRAEIALDALNNGIATVTEIARRFNRSQP